MPALPRNIDASAFKAGDYVGYCSGRSSSDSWLVRIRRGGDGWETYAHAPFGARFAYRTAPTLMALGRLLERLEG